MGGRENGPARVLWAAGAGEGERDRGLGRETELGWVCFRDGLGSLFLFYSISKTNTQILIEFKFQFEFKPSTQTKRTMHQHECNNKIKPRNFFNYL